MNRLICLLLAVISLSGPRALAAEPTSTLIKIALLDGQNNHDWRATSPLIRAALEQTGQFSVTVITCPAADADATAWDKFQPDFAPYAAVVSNFNDFGAKPAPAAFLDRLTNYVARGGGWVSVHAAGSGFPHYPEMARMAGLAWGLKSDFGTALAYDDQDQLVRISQGEGEPTGHGPPSQWSIKTRAPNHPVMRGLPDSWTYGPDELWYRARGPAQQLTVLATAYSADTHRHEPIIWTVAYGRGRVFSTLMGHDAIAMKQAAFAVVLTRGCQWAATGKITLPAPAKF
jgi:uncharacterized protein